MKSIGVYIYKRVMVIDDNCIDRYIAERIMVTKNFCSQVLPYGNAVDALEYLKTNQDNITLLPELIFVDIHMPEMSGFEFMKAYHQLSHTLKKHCSVYIVSSTIDPEDIKRVKNDPNVIAFRVKPLDSSFFQKLAK